MTPRSEHQQPKEPTGISLLKCECGNDSFRIIETADWIPELGQWEGNETIRLCTKCGKQIGCFTEELKGISITGKELQQFRSRPHPAPAPGNYELCQTCGYFMAWGRQGDRDAAIVRKAREDVLNKLTVAVADMGFPMIDKTNEFDDGRACAYGYFMREISKLRGGGCTSCHCLVSDEDVKMEEELRDFPNEGDGY